MGNRLRRALVAAVAGAVVVSGLPSGAVTRRERIALAARYIASRQQADGSIPGFSPVGGTADAVLALAAARRGAQAVADALAFLEGQAPGISSVGQLGKVAMAAVAAGRDPRAFGGVDLVERIQAAYDPETGRYGTDQGVGVVDQALAMLGLAAAGVPVPRRAARWLAEAQCPDGGWQFDAPYDPATDDRHCSSGEEDLSVTDTNSTAYAVMALEVAPPVRLRRDPFRYFDLARDGVKGGWRFDHRRRPFGTLAVTDANSTALVLQAYAAAGAEPPPRARRALAALQYRPCGRLAGAFAFTWVQRDGRWVRSPSRAEARAEAASGGVTVIGATVGAVPGLA
ncbi:MAG TPA: hypothetical protein VNO79_04840, partial [Actinomycetota bacterium]|nr:hypothetical protein [Actinomycetota bacterium]